MGEVQKAGYKMGPGLPSKPTQEVSSRGSGSSGLVSHPSLKAQISSDAQEMRHMHPQEADV